MLANRVPSISIDVYLLPSICANEDPFPSIGLLFPPIKN